MADRKKQHIIPNCYLKAWCDPGTPAGQQPYIWRISKDGSTKRRRSPEKSFTETDKYTVTLPSGERNLVIEDTLGRIESDSLSVRARIRQREKLTELDRARLCIFAAAMHTRTSRMGEHWKRQNERLHEVVVDMEKAHGVEPRTSKQTEKLVRYAKQFVIALGVKHETPLLFEMPMTIVCTDDNQTGFITSDAPCVWFNSKLHTFPPFYRSPGLAQKDIEVTLPLSPHHFLLISHTAFPLYQNVSLLVVDELNRRTQAHCSEEFVSWKGMVKPYWFERRNKPDDCWEDTEVGKQALAKEMELDRQQSEWERGQQRQETLTQPENNGEAATEEDDLSHPRSL